jgi:hypothetical protein
MLHSITAACLLLGLLASCKPASKKSPVVAEPAAATVKMVGVKPASFVCESLLSDEQMSQLTGGVARHFDGGMPSPAGVAAPCNYAVTFAGGGSGSAAPIEQAWTYDVDCRPSAKDTADKLFAQYTKTSKDLVDQYNAAAAAGTLEVRDGGGVPAAPTGSQVVQVGASGLDHHGQGLVFWDNDAPCYVRVVGGKTESRLAVAKHLADTLTPTNAPMTPRVAM